MAENKVAKWLVPFCYDARGKVTGSDITRLDLHLCFQSNARIRKSDVPIRQELTVCC